MDSVMNETLMSPNTTFSPSNYPDKKSIIAAYKRAVSTHLDNMKDRATLQTLLKEFQRSLIVEELVERLKPLLNHPKRRTLFHYIRPLIPARLRHEYNSLLPNIPNFDQQIYHIRRKGSESLGISIRGGFEFGCGSFVSAVHSASRAAQAGIKVGDEILRINGLTLLEATTVEVASLLKLNRSLTLQCRSIGMLPELNLEAGCITWKDVSDPKRKQSKSRLSSEGPPIAQNTKRLQLNVEGTSVGISVETRRNKSTEKGVIIRDVVPNSPADNAGLKSGDEIIKVDEHSLVGVPHEKIPIGNVRIYPKYRLKSDRKVIELLTSSDTLMITIKVDPTHPTPARYNQGLAGRTGGIFGMFVDPPEHFELGAQDFDIDSEITPDVQLDYKDTFLLKPKEGEKKRVEAEQKEHGPKYDRLSVLEMEADPTKGITGMSSPAAEGFGFSLALPTLQSLYKKMAGEQKKDSSEVNQGPETGHPLDASLISVPGLTTPVHPKPQGTEMARSDPQSRESAVIDMKNFGDAPQSISKLFSPGIQQSKKIPPKTLPKPVKRDAQSLKEEKSNLFEAEESETLPKPENNSKIFSSYQIPDSDSEDEGEKRDSVHPLDLPRASVGFPDLSKQPTQSALRKPSDSGPGPNAITSRKISHPSFSENIEVIDFGESITSTGTNPTTMDELALSVHPSNMDFGEDVLKGRKVAFHTVPKSGPLMMSIKGGTDTDGEKGIYISAMKEGGAAQMYGRLHVGDQILVVDGVGLLDVTHQEAVSSLMRAMSMESTSIDLVVAVSKENESNVSSGSGSSEYTDASETESD